ncbi:MAG TPA: SDR family NAD(P)-dependent oxidoreductase [Jatrophihabitantaceae bacterium]|nr:SDR family NAD(P)-dependent oxidoreductase [Jatrophihabitantaceae bacterium]
MSRTAATRVDLTGRRVLVTGAGPGSLGLATATALADWGADVVVTRRADLDLADATSVRRFAESFTGPLDVLVNNAGIHLDLRSSWTAPTMTADGFEVHWRTNYLGTAQLTALLMPRLADSPDPRVVNVVSKLHARAHNADLFAPREPYDSWAAYGASKLALIHHAFELQRRCAPVQGYALHPGSVYTHIADRGLEGHRVLGALRRVFAPVERAMLLTPEQGAQTTLHCATARELEGGQYFRNCAATEPTADALDADVSARLWDQTQAWLATL